MKATLKNIPAAILTLTVLTMASGCQAIRTENAARAKANRVERDHQEAGIFHDYDYAMDGSVSPHQKMGHL